MTAPVRGRVHSPDHGADGIAGDGAAERKRRGPRRLPVLPLLVALGAIAVASAVVSLAFGAESIPLRDVVEVMHARVTGRPLSSSAFDTIVWDLRTPRALLALVVGAGLSIAGGGMQTLVRNPLADPYLLGISAGASVGATAVITFGVFSSFGLYSLAVGAMVGALGSAALVYLVASAQGGLTPLRLILSGVVMSSAFSAIASFMVFLSDDSRAANSVMFWTLGSVAGATWDKLLLPAVAVAVMGSAMLILHGWLDALAAGPETANALGVRVGALRSFLFIGLSILIGVLVALAGGIGFVGLIVPHAARILVGATHRVMLPVAAAGGAVFMLWVDVVSRVVARPQEIPLGVITGVVGAPLFLLLMSRSRYRFGGTN